MVRAAARSIHCWCGDGAVIAGRLVDVGAAAVVVVDVDEVVVAAGVVIVVLEPAVDVGWGPTEVGVAGESEQPPITMDAMTAAAPIESSRRPSTINRA